MTHSELERIAIVETKVDALTVSVDELRHDVKAIRSAIDAGGGALGLISRIVPWLALVISGGVAVLKP
jgi:hypothetical protein